MRTRSQVDVIELTNAVMANPRSFELSLVANPELAQLLFTEMAKQSVLKLEAALAQLSPVPAEVKHSLLPMDMAAVAKSMGMNFIGPEQWKGNFGADVGVAPPIPTEITEALLESDCPIAPGRKVKDTHILVLVPETMDGKPYTALAFGNYCLSRARSDETPLLRIPRYSGCWNTKPWASQPQSESEWVLTPKVFMARTGPKERQFLDKGIVEQEAIYATHYSSEYRPARALEMMTAALLSEFINRLDTRNYKESYLIGRGFNCSDRTSEGFPVCVGPFNSDGLAIYNSTDVGDFQIGFALARRL